MSCICKNRFEINHFCWHDMDSHKLTKMLVCENPCEFGDFACATRVFGFFYSNIKGT